MRQVIKINEKAGNGKMNLEEKDRIGQYLTPHLDEIVFDELSDAYLAKAGVADILTDVPVPLRKSELGGISTLTIAKAMAFVIGCDPEFKYKENYVSYIRRSFGEKFAAALVAEGVEAADEKNDYDYACIMFRGAMQIDPENAGAYYCYGRACKDAYETAAADLGVSEDAEEFVGRFKAEALEAFEVATIKDPKLAEAFYFLGYAYVNMGLYVKSKLTWEEYMRLTEEAASIDETDEKMRDEGFAARIKELRELRKEIALRLESLEKPVEIEKGYNLVISGRYEEGIELLSEYKEGEFASWWPLWFYLGTAHAELGENEEAVSCFTEVLKYAPSNIESMEELVKLYEKLGDEEKAKKYASKAEIVKDNMEKDRQLAEENRRAEEEKQRKLQEIMTKDGSGRKN